jgi:protein-ribulosamine 3-kinase
VIPPAAARWLEEQGFGQITGQRPIGGGCINNGARLSTSSGRQFFLKTNHSTPPDMFAREAEGLEALRHADGPRLPQPYLHGPTFLLMEDLSPAPPQPGYWASFGRQLARLHQHTHDRFGFHHDNYLGSTPQPNPWTADGFEFFARQRLMFQADLAHENGLLSPSDHSRVDRLAAHLKELVPVQPASLIHGDLWSGNAIAGDQGEPALIDPAAHYGWAEAELGMTVLFGGFPGEFYRAYQAERALEPGWEERLPLYNLYHLLNHVNLFGGSYLSQVQSILRRFSK